MVKNWKSEEFQWLEYALDVIHTGSREICYRPPKDTDDDYLILVDVDTYKTLYSELIEQGWKQGGYSHYSSKLLPLDPFPPFEHIQDKKASVFHAFRKEEINLICTASTEYFENFKKATKLAKYLNLRDKDDRVTLFQAVIQDIWPGYNLKDFQNGSTLFKRSRYGCGRCFIWISLQR